MVMLARATMETTTLSQESISNTLPRLQRVGGDNALSKLHNYPLLKQGS